MMSALETIRWMAGLLDSVGIAACMFDEAPNTLFWNRSFLDLFPEHDGHVHAGEPYACNLRRFYQGRLSPAELPNIDRYIADGIARHLAQSLPYVFQHRGQWLRVASLPLPGTGRIRLWGPVSAPDADRVLRDTLRQGRPNPTIEDVADGVMTRDQTGAIQSVNERFRMLYRLDTTASVVGRSLPELLSELWGDHPMLAAALLALSDNERFAGAPFEIPLPDDRWIRISEQPTRERALISTHADISELHRLRREAEAARQRAEAARAALELQIAERERAEAALRQAQRVESIGQLTGGIAHDFNNLLSVVLGNIEMLVGTETDPGRLGLLDVARAAVDRGARLTGQLLAFARQQPLRPRAVNIAALVADMTPLLHSALGRRITLVPPRPAGFMAMVDPTQLELVVLNIAINARDAMAGHGTLWIEIEPAPAPEDIAVRDFDADGYVRIGLRDDGPGMTAEVRERAFEPFYTTKPTGSGLGLSQVYGVARQSGGIARITSAPGKGTRVDVVLPMARGTGEAFQVPPPSAPARGPTTATVLLVDDNADLLAVTARLLGQAGYDVLQASSGDEALRFFETGRRIDLLLTDVSMPRMSGPDLAIRALQLRPDLRVLFISGYADAAALGERFAGTPLLRKPARMRDMAGAIAKALGQA
jgi:signal transduction histidine kinase